MWCRPTSAYATTVRRADGCMIQSHSDTARRQKRRVRVTASSRTRTQTWNYGCLCFQRPVSALALASLTKQSRVLSSLLGPYKHHRLGNPHKRDRRPFNGPFFRATWVSRHGKGKKVLRSCRDGRPFGHNRRGPKIGGLCPFWQGQLGPHVTQCGLGRGLPPYQVAS